MKTALTAILIAVLSATLRPQSVAEGAPPPSEIDSTTRFIFYSALEGLYEDGVSNQDVDQILLRKEHQSYSHFIYACPICTATIWALQAYRSRPEQFYSLKSPSPNSTFGPGLPNSLRAELFSDDPHRRLKGINTLVKDWIGRRMDRKNLSEKDREGLLKALEGKRKQGMEALESLRRQEHGPSFGLAEGAPAYFGLTECAVCNGAVGKLMKLPNTTSRH
jgi:hypothetical protein